MEENYASEWRYRFMENNECWSVASVADHSALEVPDPAAIVSKWLQEGKIFSVRHDNQEWFPSFQFDEGSPAPVISKVTELFPADEREWNLAFFFSTPNAYIGGRLPIELIRADPDLLVSLAERFANPADVF